jgi:hypothetical protein
MDNQGYSLPKELVDVATKLEKQFQQLEIPSRKIKLDEWEVLPAKAKELIPFWLMNLLANHSLTGPILERAHESGSWQRYFCFWSPDEYLKRITPDDPIRSENNDWWLSEIIVGLGFIPISDESDGDMWIASVADGPSAPVYVYSLTAHEKVLMGDSMASFLAGFRISEDQSE